MTKEEAIKLIDDRMCFGRGKWSEHHRPERDVYWQAGEMAIEALEAEQLPSAQPEQLGTNLAQLGTDLISRQTAIDAIDVLCQEHRYKIPGKGETYSQYNEAWQDALDRAEGAIFNLPSAHPEIIRCKDCKWRMSENHKTISLWLPCRALITPDEFSCIYAERGW